MTKKDGRGAKPPAHQTQSRTPSPESLAASAEIHREYPKRPVVGVGAVITVAADDRRRLGVEGTGPARGVILIRRRFPPLAGEWSLPGGTVEVGETLEAATAREIVEETGLAVEIGPVVDVFDRIMLDESRRVQYHFVLVDYACRAVGGRLCAGSDVSDAIVADPADLEPYRLTDKARSVIARALEMIDAHSIPDPRSPIPDP